MSSLTTRGKVVISLVVIALSLWALGATTPDECKVPIEKMSSFCIDLLYP